MSTEKPEEKKEEPAANPKKILEELDKSAATPAPQKEPMAVPAPKEEPAAALEEATVASPKEPAEPPPAPANSGPQVMQPEYSILTPANSPNYSASSLGGTRTPDMPLISDAMRRLDELLARFRSS